MNVGNNFLYFSNAAQLIRETVEPSLVKSEKYIGLEHIQEGTLHLSHYGYAEDVNSIKSRFKKGDILFGKLRPYFRKLIIAPFDGISSTDIWVIRAKKGVDQKFLFYWMASEDFINHSMAGAEGARMPRASWEYAGRLSCQIVDFVEQKAIARILSSLDDKIELNQQMKRTLEAQARAIFKSWFVDFDPVRAKMEGRQPAGMDAATAALFPDAFEDSPLGMIPKGWTVKPFDDVANFLNGLALQKYPPNGDDYLSVIKIAELRRGVTGSSGKASMDIPKEYIIQSGDVLFSWSGSLTVCIWCGGKGALNQHLFKVTSKYYPKWFYYQWVNHYLPVFQAIAASKATTMGHIQRHHLSEALVIIPPENILQVMDKTMMPLLQKSIPTSLESSQLSAIRDTLLPKLISGEIRVKEAEKIVREAA